LRGQARFHRADTAHANGAGRRGLNHRGTFGLVPELSEYRLASLSEVQAGLVRFLKSIEPEVGSPFIMADTFSPEITCWFLGDRTRLLELLSRSSYFVSFRFSTGRRGERKQGESVRWFSNSEVEAMASITVHDRIFRGKWLAYGAMSGVKILFPFPSRVPGTVRVADYSFLQMEAREDEFADLPSLDVLGERFSALPNLDALVKADAIPEKVDLVYTWVDGTDPNWLAQKRAIVGEAASENFTPDGDITARFVSRNELLYSLRSAWMYFRNLGKIYIVTCGQRPSFLKEDSAVIKFIDHRDIFPNAGDLPTFNSHAIESNLHRIPGLSEKYLYLNDDVFFCRPVTSKLFFDEYDRSLYFQSRSITIPSGPANASDQAGDAAAKNARDLLQQKFGVYATRKFKHTPIAITKSVVAEMEREWPEIFRNTSATKIRSFRDFAISGSFYFHFATCIGKATAGDIVYGYFDINTDEFMKQITEHVYAELDTKRLDVMCVNDSSTTDRTSLNEQSFLRIMREIYPEPAPFEIGQ
jgi:hypothetical protein